jgi:hypothetical protein
MTSGEGQPSDSVCLEVEGDGYARSLAGVERFDRDFGDRCQRPAATVHRPCPGWVQLGDLHGCGLLPATGPPGHDGSGAHGERAITFRRTDTTPLPFGEVREAGRVGEDVAGTTAGVDAFRYLGHLASCFVRSAADGAHQSVAEAGQVELAASLTLLPAMLGLSGRAIDRLHLPGLLQSQAPQTRHGLWWRWSRTVQRRPLLCGSAALLVLTLLAAPLFSMRLAFTDSATTPPP